MKELLKKLERKKFETTEIKNEIKTLIYKNISDAIQDNSKDYFTITKIHNNFDVDIEYTFDSILFNELKILQLCFELVGYNITHIGSKKTPKVNQPNHTSIIIILKLKDEKNENKK